MNDLSRKPVSGRMREVYTRARKMTSFLTRQGLLQGLLQDLLQGLLGQGLLRPGFQLPV